MADRIVCHDGPSTMTVSILNQPENNRYCAHILSYIPVRKSETIDIIEERTKLYNITLNFNLPVEVKQAMLVPEGTQLKLTSNSVTIPVIDGYTILELDY